jgi:hypothetical protein
MMPTQGYRRPRVLRDARDSKLFLPGRSFPFYESSQPGWREIRLVTFQARLVRLLAVSALVLAMLALLLFRR